MAIPINLLLLEDDPGRADLIIAEIRNGGFLPSWQRVQTERDYKEQLSPSLDLILAECNLNQFDAGKALRVLKNVGLNIPFIVVSDVINEELAASLMKEGATDYILKDRLACLGQAVIDALENKKLQEEKQQAQNQLWENEKRFRQLVDNISDIIYRYRCTTPQGFEYISPAVKNITGYNPEEFYKEPSLLLELTHPEDRHFWDHLLPQTRDLAVSLTLRGIHKEGKTIWVELKNSPVYDQSGQLIAIEGIARDITERKNIEDKISQAKQEWEHTFDSVTDLIAIIDQHYKIKRVNRALAQRLNLSPKDLVGKTCYKGIHGAQLPPAFCPYNQVLVDGNGQTFELEEDQLGGTFTVKLSPLYSGDGRVVGCVDVFHDVTERKKAEEALRESELKFRTVFAQSKDAICITSSEGKVVDFNQSALDLFGYKREEIIGQSVLKLYSQVDDRTRFQREIEEKGFVRDYYLKLRKKDGTEIDCMLTSTLRISQDGNILGYQGIFRDITDSKRAEEVVRTTEERYRNLFEEAPVMYVISRAQGKGCFIVECNNLFLTTLGYTRAEVIGRSIADFYTHESRMRNNEEGDYKRALEGCFNPEERFLLTRNGKIVETLLYAYPENDPEGNVSGTRAIYVNISTIKKGQAELEKTLRDLKKTIVGTIQAMSVSLELRDPYTVWHQKRVSKLAHAIALKMKVKEDQLEGIRLTGLIHDIGKICVPNEILNKTAKIDTQEYSIIKAHPQAGYNILKQIEFPWPIALIVLQHHERMDGSGYPSGIKGENILLEARILAVADVVEAMASHRPYRPARKINMALAEISRHRKTIYDPVVVDACLKLFQETGFQFD